MIPHDFSSALVWLSYYYVDAYLIYWHLSKVTEAEGLYTIIFDRLYKSLIPSSSLRTVSITYYIASTTQ